MVFSRRAMLSGMVTSTASVLGGCIGELQRTSDSDATAGGIDSANSDNPFPLTATSPFLEYDLSTLQSELIEGVVPQDGVPSIDRPKFTSAERARVDSGEPVIGVIYEHTPRAYPQFILNHHEIVNDSINEEPVAITYCPLTDTAQGFYRGEATFGVSGHLLNSNLVMYDRLTESLWPQMIATAISGQFEGKSLEEFRLIRTSFDRWVQRHPETEVLSRDTGYIRNYDTNPYGGYGAGTSVLFSPLTEDDREHPNRPVLGARTHAGSIAFHLWTLIEERILYGNIGDAQVVAVADPNLQTGYAYLPSNEDEIIIEGDGYRVNGSVYTADSLPLPSVLAYAAFWFAWVGFYPSTKYIT